jgi:hypothetical protein
MVLFGDHTTFFWDRWGTRTFIAALLPLRHSRGYQMLLQWEVSDFFQKNWMGHLTYELAMNQYLLIAFLEG